MKGKFKRIIALLMMVVMTMTTTISCNDSGNRDKETKSVEYLTRGQWITMLAQRFGMTDYFSDTPYYSDVDSDSEIFQFVQSCYEWGILSTGTDTFKPDEIATTGFVISTSVLATGINYSEYMTGDDPNEGILGLANAKGITNIKYGEDSKLTEGICLVEAAVILNSAVTCYLEEDNGDENYAVATYKEDVVDKTEEENLVINDDASQVTMSKEQAEDIQEGTVFLVPTEEFPEGYALKAVSKTTNEDGTCVVNTERPEIYEVLDAVDIDSTVVADSEHFTPAEGVTIVEDSSSNINNCVPTVVTSTSQTYDLNGTEYKVSETAEASLSAAKTITLNVNLLDGSTNLVEDQTLTGKLSKMQTYFDNFEFKGKSSQKSNDDYKSFVTTAEGSRVGFDVDRAYYAKMDELADQYQAGTISQEQFCSQLEAYKQEITEDAEPVYKYKAGYSLTGKIELQVAATAKAKIDFDWANTKVEEFSVTVDSKTSSNITLAGKFVGEQKLGEFNIPLNGGFGINIEVKLFVEANGEIAYNFEICNTTKVEYKSDGGFKSAAEKSAKQSVDVKVSLEAGANLVACLTFWGFDILDVGITASALLEAKTSFYIKDGVEASPSDNTVTIYEEVGMKSDATLYLPIIKLKVGCKDGSVLNTLGLSLELKLCSKDMAQQIKIYDGSDIVKVSRVIDLEEESTEETTQGGTRQGLSIDTYVTVLNVNDTVNIQYTLPTGYTDSDLVWSVGDSSIATVSGGKVTGKQEGTTNITVKTKDGKYKAESTIVVNQ